MIQWPDFELPPINQYVLISAYDFYKLKEQYGLPSVGLRNINFSERDTLLTTKQVVFDWDENIRPV